MTSTWPVNLTEGRTDWKYYFRDCSAEDLVTFIGHFLHTGNLCYLVLSHVMREYAWISIILLLCHRPTIFLVDGKERNVNDVRPFCLPLLLEVVDWNLSSDGAHVLVLSNLNRLLATRNNPIVSSLLASESMKKKKQTYLLCVSLFYHLSSASSSLRTSSFQRNIPKGHRWIKFVDRSSFTSHSVSSCLRPSIFQWTTESSNAF